MRQFLVIIFLFSVMQLTAQLSLEPGDPSHNPNIPSFYKSSLADIEAEVAAVKKGSAEVIARSASGYPIYAIRYGEKDDIKRMANYNSAVGARNPAYFAVKGEESKPVFFFLGPVHGQEPEGLVGVINLIHIAETGLDYRGREWPKLKKYFDQSRVIIVPCGNPDGRKRVPYFSFVGLPAETMTKYGQGTKRDGTLWRWPASKSLHPMVGDVGILGGYYTDKGINIMHDDFFNPMAEETKAILQVARDEIPDITVSLHSCACKPYMIQAAHAPLFMKERLSDLSRQVNQAFIDKGLPHMGEGWALRTIDDDPKFPPRSSFNLVSALHHQSGTMSFTFESPHGTLEDGATHEDILDIQLTLYEEMFEYIFNNRILWEREEH